MERFLMRVEALSRSWPETDNKRSNNTETELYDTIIHVYVRRIDNMNASTRWRVMFYALLNDAARYYSIR